MTGLDQAVGTRFEWRQPEAFRRYHELMADGRNVASLRFEKGCGTLATAEYGDAQWTFKRSGFWSPRVSVRQAGSQTDLAVFTPRWTGGGELAFAGGLKFPLKSLSFWGGEWAFETEDGSEVVSVRGPHGLVRNSGEAALGSFSRKPAGNAASAVVDLVPATADAGRCHSRRDHNGRLLRIAYFGNS